MKAEAIYCWLHGRPTGIPFSPSSLEYLTGTEEEGTEDAMIAWIDLDKRVREMLLIYPAVKTEFMEYIELNRNRPLHEWSNWLNLSSYLRMALETFVVSFIKERR